MKAYWLSNPRRPVYTSDLYKLGVICAGWMGSPEALVSDFMARGYAARDEVRLSADTPNYDTICAKFDKEHYHSDDEVRIVAEGSGIFDVRSKSDKWIRIEVERGDAIIVPAGMHHRFYMTDRKHIRAIRLFKDASGWTPHYRA